MTPDNTSTSLIPRRRAARLGLTLLALFALFASSTAMSSCAQLGIKKPTVKYSNIKFVAADWDKLSVNVTFDVHNPNILGAKVDGYKLHFSVDGLTLVDGVINQAFDLRAGRTAKLSIPITVKWKEILSKITKGFSGGGLPFRIAGDVRFNTGTAMGQLKLPFRHEARLPVIQAPDIGLKGMRIGKTSFTAVDLIVDMEIANSGSAIKLAGLNYALKLAGKSVAQSSLATKAIGARGKATQSITFRVNPAQLGLALFQSLTANKPITTALTGTTTVDTGFGKLPLNFNDLKNLLPIK